jgi:two-component system, OmpR family, alkaline phosphatase synthesis response regulator PhoP
MTNTPTRILVVDDEEDICEILKFNLESEGYLVDVVSSAEDALKRKLDGYGLFLLDIMMKGMSGYRLADELRKKHGVSAPFLFITARTSENDKLTGFSLGADDFITKPFSVREVIARIKAVLRRSETTKAFGQANIIEVSGITLDMEQKRMLVNGSREDLTPIEFQLLSMLMKSPGKVFNREQFLQRIWGEVNVTDRTVDVHITRLRKKLGVYGNLLIARKGYGYSFEYE